MSSIQGNEGNNDLSGDAGNNIIYGYKGDDYLDGREGDDYLDGGAGNDFLFGGLGSDSLMGGEGNDIFYLGFDNTHLINNKWVVDELNDYQLKGQDTIIFSEDYPDPSEFKKSIMREGWPSTEPGHPYRTSNDYFIIDSLTGVLYYDRDGRSRQFKPVKIAKLPIGTTANELDILVLENQSGKTYLVQIPILDIRDIPVSDLLGTSITTSKTGTNFLDVSTIDSNLLNLSPLSDLALSNATVLGY